MAKPLEVSIVTPLCQPVWFCPVRPPPHHLGGSLPPTPPRHVNEFILIGFQVLFLLLSGREGIDVKTGKEEVQEHQRYEERKGTKREEKERKGKEQEERRKGERREGMTWVIGSWSDVTFKNQGSLLLFFLAHLVSLY